MNTTDNRARNFMCMKCDKSFLTTRMLNAHMVTTHGTSLPIQRKKKPKKPKPPRSDLQKAAGAMYWAGCFRLQNVPEDDGLVQNKFPLSIMTQKKLREYNAIVKSLRRDIHYDYKLHRQEVLADRKHKEERLAKEAKE